MFNYLAANHTWYEMWGPIPLIIVAILAFLYWTKMVRSSFYHVTNSQIRYFFSALIIFYVVKGSPFALIASNYLFSAHVVQVATTLFIVVPLIILSLPIEFYRSVFWDYRMKFMLRLFAHPWVNALIFNGLLTLYFVPPVFNLLQGNMILITIAQMILLIQGFLMWWVIISPLPEVSKVENLTKVAYIFFTSAILLPISFFLLVILKVHYPFYDAVAGNLVPVLTTIYDQQLGGGLLKITQLACYAYALLKIILHWGKEEEEKEGKVDDESIRVVQGVVIRLHDKK